MSLRYKFVRLQKHKGDLKRIIGLPSYMETGMVVISICRLGPMDREPCTLVTQAQPHFNLKMTY
jgi:hypothetical protein